MAKIFRYALAAICLATSAGCLAWWWRSFSVSDRFLGPQFFSSSRLLVVECCHGYAIVTSANQFAQPILEFQRLTGRDETRLTAFEARVKSEGRFAANGRTLYFPLWYPALVCAVAAIGVLRLDGRFTIRSALLATLVVTLLLGLAAAL